MDRLVLQVIDLRPFFRSRHRPPRYARTAPGMSPRTFHTHTREGRRPGHLLKHFAVAPGAAERNSRRRRFADRFSLDSDQRRDVVAKITIFELFAGQWC